VKSSPPARSVRPTLFSPPNSFSLRSWPSTTTRAARSSIARSQPPPYSNGASNIAKKSPWVNRTWPMKGLTSVLAGSSGSTLGNIAAWRLACFAFHSAVASL